MWILPMAYGYLLQAGSIGNDLTATTFALTSGYFALRYRAEQKPAFFYYSVLGAALMTSVKLSNIPLVLVWVAALGLTWRPVLKKPVTMLGVALVVLLCSALPTLLLNRIHASSITGTPHDSYQVLVRKPVWGLLGNCLVVTKHTLMPPVFPGSHRIWSAIERKLPPRVRERLQQEFPRYFKFKLPKLPLETETGLGLGFTFLAVTSGVVGIIARRKRGARPETCTLCVWMGLAAWIAALWYMVTIRSEAAGRLMLPYYPFLAAPLLCLSGRIPGGLWTLPWFRTLAYLAMVSSLVPLVFSPFRPLIPITVTERLLGKGGEGHASYFFEVYRRYRCINDLFLAVRTNIPPEVRLIAFIGEDDVSVSLWRPFGTRRVVYSLRDANKHAWHVIKSEAWHLHSSTELDKWLAENGLEVKGRFAIRALEPEPGTWYLAGPPGLAQLQTPNP